MPGSGTLVGRGYVSIRPEFEGDWSRQARAQSDSAGSAGGNAFTKSFGKILSVGMKGAFASLGTSAAAALAPAVGAAGLLAPTMLAAASAGASLKVGMSGVGDAVKAAFDPTNPKAFSAAMAKLSPNARAFVTELRSTKPALDGLKKSVQDKLFEDMGATFATTAKRDLPIFRKSLTDSAGTLNLMGRDVLNTATGLGKSGALGKALGSANEGLKNMSSLPATIVQGLVQIGAAAGPAFAGLTKQAGGAVNQLSVGLANAFKSGGMQTFIENGVTILQGLASTLGDAFAVVGNILKAAAGAGGQVLGVLGSVFAELRQITDMPGVQKALTQVFTAVSQIAAAIGPVIGSAVQAIVPIVAAIAPVIAGIAAQLGPVLVQLVTTLGQALTPIITALLPVVQTVGTALVQVVSGVAPLLAPIGQLVASVITALAPALTPIINTITQLVTVLVGPLTSIVTALTPVLTLVGQVIAKTFGALAPFLTPLVTLIGQVAALVANVFATALTAVLTAITPLLPVGIQLVQSVLGALAPILPIIGTALSVVASAMLGLLTPLTQVFGVLAKQLAPVFASIGPIIGQLAGVVLKALAGILPVVASALMSLLQAFMPIMPLVTQVLGLVIGLGASLLAQLLPPLLQLVTTAVSLALAFLPIIPPLTQIIGLVVTLATGLLTTLLPPLVKLVSFLAGVLAVALGTVIGWFSKLVAYISSFVGPIIKWIGGIISSIVNGILNVFRNLYNVLIGHSILPDIVNYIRGAFAAVFHWIYDKVIHPVWTAISTVISGVWNNSIKPVFNAVKTAVHLVGDAFGKAKDAIGKAWGQLQSITKKPVNFVISSVYTHGIKAVWDKVADFVHLPKLPTAPKLLAAGGTVGNGFGPAAPMVTNRPTAIVGEGRPAFPEFVIPTDPKYRPRALALWQAAGGRLMKDGGILGDVGSFFSGAAKKVGGAFMSGVDFLTNPGKLWDKAVGFIKDKVKTIGSAPWAKMIGAFPGKMLSSLKTKIVNAAKDFFGSSGGGKIPTGQHAAIISQALAAAHVPPPGTLAQWLTGMNTLITRESGWNAGAINLTDSNAKAGHPSQGLTQTIPSTFFSFVPPALRFKGITDPVANVAASIRYIKSRYGNITNVQQANASLPPKGYDNGGLLMPGWTPVYNGLGKPEAVFTPSQLKNLTSPAAGSDQPVRVEIHTRDESLADFVDVRVYDANERLIQNLTAGGGR